MSSQSDRETGYNAATAWTELVDNVRRAIEGELGVPTRRPVLARV